jgi:hypothetical protein
LADEGSLTRSFATHLYGFIKMESFYDNSDVAQGDWLLFVRSGSSSYADQNVFSMSVRHTRLGLNFSGPTFGTDGTIIGKIETDFAGGFPNSSTAARQPVLRIRHAWIELNKPAWEARFGQDWALIAGPFPNTTSFVVGAGKGNLWMRYPQIRFTIKTKPMRFAVSLNRPMAGNVKYDDFAQGDFDPVGDGERSGLPWIMARSWLSTGNLTLSVSGHYGQEKIPDLTGNQHDMKTVSVNADFQLKTGPFSMIVKGFMGENLNSFFGGVFQGFTRDSVSVSNIASKGGWAQAQIQIKPAWSITLGGGMDDPDDDDLSAGHRSRNDWFFANIAWQQSKAVSFTFEGEYLKTSYIQEEAGKNIRLMLVTYYRF